MFFFWSPGLMFDTSGVMSHELDTSYCASWDLQHFPSSHILLSCTYSSCCIIVACLFTTKKAIRCHSFMPFLKQVHRSCCFTEFDIHLHCAAKSITAKCENHVRQHFTVEKLSAAEVKTLLNFRCFQCKISCSALSEQRAACVLNLYNADMLHTKAK